MKIRTLLPHLALSLLFALPLSTHAASFEDRMKEVKEAVEAKRSAGKDAFYAELETQARALLKEFPDKKDPYQLLMAVAQNSSPEKAKEIFKELQGDKVPEEIKERVKGQLAKFDALGKPLDIKFKAVDGREVDLASMKGKVVLVDFWATWCGPCVAEVPHVVEAYNKLHEKGFEIVGISLDRDTDKDKLVSFVKENKMPWPQFYDGLFWKNSIAQKYGINSIPAMWLVDKKGNLVDMNGRDGLTGKVEKLLAE